MAGLMGDIQRRNKRLKEASNAAREARGGSQQPARRPGPRTGSRNKQRGLRAAPARPARRMQTNLPVNRPMNRPQSISGGNRRQQQIRDIEARIKALGG